MCSECALAGGWTVAVESVVAADVPVPMARAFVLPLLSVKMLTALTIGITFLLTTRLCGGEEGVANIERCHVAR